MDNPINNKLRTLQIKNFLLSNDFVGEDCILRTKEEDILITKTEHIEAEFLVSRAKVKCGKIVEKNYCNTISVSFGGCADDREIIIRLEDELSKAQNKPNPIQLIALPSQFVVDLKCEDK